MIERQSCRRLAGSLLALTMAVATVAPAEARVGSSRGSSSRSYSAPTRPPAYSPPPSTASRPSSGRVGSGGAVGMQRPDVTARARTNPAVPQQGAGGFGAPAAGAVAGAGTGAAIGGAPRAGYGVPSGGAAAQAAPQQRGGSWVGPAIAGAAVGAAAGYALGNRGEQPAAGSDAGADGKQAPADGGSVGAAPESSGGASGAFPDAAQSAPRQSGMGFMSFGLIALLLAAAAMYLFRRKAAKTASTGALSRSTGHAPAFPSPGSAAGSASIGAGNMGALDAPGGYGAASGYGAVAGHGVATGSTDADVDAQGLMGLAKTFYTQLQDLNNRGDLAGLRARTTDDLYPMLAADIQARVQPSHTSVMSVDAQLLDFTREANRSIASVQFHSVVSEGPNEAPHPVDEVWHFVLDDMPSAQWKLAGIEQV